MIVPTSPQNTNRHIYYHYIRMRMIRGGGVRGGKGSLPRYLLDHGVLPKVMTGMISTIIMFNYIPDDEVFEEAIKLFQENMESTLILI